MTVGARDGKVASTQAEGRFVVARQGECRWPKLLQAVAIFAAVEMWRSGELSGMFIGVTVGAELKLNLVDREVAFRDVALRARQIRMLAL